MPSSDGDVRCPKLIPLYLLRGRMQSLPTAASGPDPSPGEGGPEVQGYLLKTGRQRMIALPHSAIAALENHGKQQAVFRDQFGPDWRKSGSLGNTTTKIVNAK